MKARLHHELNETTEALQEYAHAAEMERRDTYANLGLANLRYERATQMRNEAS
jgi:hypothetical protein